MTLNELSKRIKNEPTIMSADKEISYFESLIGLPEKEIIEHSEIFDDILDCLYESHLQVIFEVTDDNIVHFKKFADWLTQLGNLFVDKEQGEALVELAETFRLNPKEVFGEGKK